MELNKGFIYIPKNANKNKVKYLCIAAHQDDVEIMAYHGILKGWFSKKYSFSAVVTCDGAGSARTGEFKDYTDEMMKKVRIKEQQEASEIGKYHSLYMLNYTSAEVKNKDDDSVINDYINIIKELRPEVIYTHNLLDKHPTHLGVVIKVIKALRKLDKKYHPKKVLGCEVWRDLDWVDDDLKYVLDVSKKPKLAKDILNVYKSQIIGGKRYDLATIGRRYANATYAASHSVDKAKMVNFAIDLTPLINSLNLDIKQYALNYIDKFYQDVKNQLTELI